jgi:GrpB-like predicted nucleotidyltransferase (UPF0157 family)
MWSEDLDATFQTWCELRATGGLRVTVLDLYELLAETRGVEQRDLLPIERRELAERAWAATWPGFEILPEGARKAEPIEVVTYDESWPDWFDSWRSRLAGALAPAAVRIDHVGSTSVPSLAAKPIVDMQMSVERIDDEESYIPGCASVGLVLRSRDDEHRYLRPRADLPREVHLHVCQIGSEWERVHLLLRDYLRANEPARHEYAAMKREAAASWRDDGIAYNAAKTNLILDLLERAERWSIETGWSVSRPGLAVEQDGSREHAQVLRRVPPRATAPIAGATASHRAIVTIIDVT